MSIIDQSVNQVIFRPRLDGPECEWGGFAKTMLRNAESETLLSEDTLLIGHVNLDDLTCLSFAIL